jgi:hypothetical protein
MFFFRLAELSGYSVQTDHLFPHQIDHLFSSDHLVENITE